MECRLLYLTVYTQYCFAKANWPVIEGCMFLAMFLANIEYLSSSVNDTDIPTPDTFVYCTHIRQT